MKTRRELQETAVYVASVWWRDCEPFLTIVGGSAKAVETAIEAEMLRVATESYDQQDAKERERDDFLLDMARSFAERDTLGNVFPAPVLERYCRRTAAAGQGNAGDLDLLPLVNGDPNAIVRIQ